MNYVIYKGLTTRAGGETSGDNGF
jgi:hypothetical protein